MLLGLWVKLYLLVVLYIDVVDTAKPVLMLEDFIVIGFAVKVLRQRTICSSKI